MIRIFLAIFCMAAPDISALDAEQIRALSQSPHSRENLLEELEIYPEAREYKVNIKSGETLDKLQQRPELTATEKVVGGKHIVTVLNIPGAEKPMIMVVTYDEENGSFKKWVLLTDETVVSYSGVANFKLRTISWAATHPDETHQLSVLAIETFSDEGVVWKDAIFHEGSLVGHSYGEAIRTK